MTIHALLVGINHYQSSEINDLSGCENDVFLIENTFKKKFSLENKNILILKNSEATQLAIIKSFQNHLIQRVKPEDTAVFYFSGHGSQSRTAPELWKVEPDHLDESLVCYDSRQEQSDLRDKDLRYLIYELSQKCKHVLIIIDACHSGHITRLSDEPNVRQIKKDHTHYTLDNYHFSEKIKQDLSQQDSLPLGNHILLSGCLPHELSYESHKNYEVHGRFTHALCEVLNTVQYDITYHELIQRIRSNIKRYQPQQTPQLETFQDSKPNHIVLGSKIAPSHWLSYCEEKNSQPVWMLDAGFVHGCNPNDIINLYTGTHEISSGSKAITQATIQQCGTFTSQLLIPKEAELSLQQTYIAVLATPGFPRMPIGILGNNKIAKRSIEQLIQDANKYAFIKLSQTEAHYYIVCNDNEYLIRATEDKRPLFQAETKPETVLTTMENVARFWNKFSLHNPDSKLPRNAVDVIIHYNNESYVNQDVTLTSNRDKGLIEFSIELRLNYSQPLYCAIAHFDGEKMGVNTDYFIPERIICLSPEHPSIFLREGKRTRMRVPPSLIEQNIYSAQDYIKLFVSEERFEPAFLDQQPNKLYQSAKSNSRSHNLKNLLSRLIHSSTTRETVEDYEVINFTDWQSHTFTINIHQPSTWETIQATSFKKRYLTQHKEEKLHSLTLSNTHIDVEPVYLSNGKRNDLGIDQLEIRPIENTKGSAEAESFHLDKPIALNENEYIIACFQAPNSSYLIPTGFSKPKDHYIHIDTGQFIYESPEDGSKSLSGSIKLLFKKLILNDLLKYQITTHTLALLQLDTTSKNIEATITDNKSIRSTLENKQRVLILIHGIIGDTQTMTEGVLTKLTHQNQSIVQQYDAVLTFDYENLNTTIEENAQLLLEALNAIGLHKDLGHQIDILAHSMGGLISRWMIERCGGEAFINHLIMVGTPNGGSPYAGVKETSVGSLKAWAYGTLAVAINGLSTVPAGGAVVAGLVKLLDAADNSLDQMSPNSTLIKDLLLSPLPKTKYSLIAGSTEGIDPIFKDGIQYIFHNLTKASKHHAYELLNNTLFNESNDVAVSYSSMTQFPKVWGEHVAISGVSCDHMSYFSYEESLRLILKKINR